MVSSEIECMREGTTIKLAPTQIVPGDLIKLKPGFKIPADAIIFYSLDLRVDMSALTGESLPVDKKALEHGNKDTEDAHESINMVFSSNVVTSGIYSFYD